MNIYTLKDHFVFQKKKKKKNTTNNYSNVIGLNELFIKVHQRNSLRWQCT